MKNIIILSVIMAISAFGQTHKDFIGTWKVDIKKHREYPQLLKASKDKDPKRRERAESILSMLSQIKMVVTKTDIKVSSPGTYKTKAEESKDKYIVIKSDGKTLEIKWNIKNKEKLILVTFIEKDSISFKPKNITPGEPAGGMMFYIIFKKK